MSPNKFISWKERTDYVHVYCVAFLSPITFMTVKINDSACAGISIRNVTDTIIQPTGNNITLFKKITTSSQNTTNTM